LFQSISDYLLPQGQLTSQGFFQHLQLGAIFHTAYGDYFHKIHTSEQIYLRATNYARTIQSISALVITTLPQLFSKVEKNTILINSHEDESEELMHGIGLHHSSHNIPSPSYDHDNNSNSSHNVMKVSEAVSIGDCLLANKFTKRQLDVSKAMLYDVM